MKDSAWAVDYAAEVEGVYATVGIHPERMEEYDASQLPDFEALAAKPKVVAVGEVGLDFHRPEFKLEEQEGFGELSVRN